MKNLKKYIQEGLFKHDSKIEWDPRYKTGAVIDPGYKYPAFIHAASKEGEYVVIGFDKLSKSSDTKFIPNVWDLLDIFSELSYVYRTPNIIVLCNDVMFNPSNSKFNGHDLTIYVLKTVRLSKFDVIENIHIRKFDKNSKMSTNYLKEIISELPYNDYVHDDLIIDFKKCKNKSVFKNTIFDNFYSGDFLFDVNNPIEFPKFEGDSLIDCKRLCITDNYYFQEVELKYTVSKYGNRDEPQVNSMNRALKKSKFDKKHIQSPWQFGFRRISKSTHKYEYFKFPPEKIK